RPGRRRRAVTSTPRSARQRGFTLAELAIVFVIVALLIGGTVLTLAAQTEAREITDTQRTLDQAREAIIGFALRNGRLPCPAPLGVNGVESFCTGDDSGACGAPILAPPNLAPAHGRCSNPNGFVPAAALGIGPIETNPASPNFGLLLDTWLQPIGYAVSQVNAPAPSAANRELFTAAGEMRNHLLTAPPVVPDLLVCTTSAGAVTGVPPALPTCAGPSFQTPAVVRSTGKSPVASAGDETENVNNDRIFVSRPPSPAPAAFDDLVIWVSPNILYNRLISAGAL
ncbi:MAG: type II secretion system protein, partial [Burkholderiales bacterium]